MVTRTLSLLSAATAVLLVVASMAAPAALAQPPEGTPIDFDLRTWSQEGVPDWGSWTVSDEGATVRQTINDSPTFYVSPETFASASIEGVFEVETSGDDDYIGFVMGYAGPRTPDTTGYDYLVFNWKQAAQSFGGCQAEEGASLLRVRGTEDPAADYTPGGTAHPALWCHESRTDGAYDIDVDVLDTSWGPDEGWADNTEYTFTLEYSPTAVRVLIDGVEVVSASGTFPEGAFGFYNYSQSDVRYSGFRAVPMEPDAVPGEPGVSRVDGGSGDPIDAAIEICQFLVPADGTAELIALARVDDFADAMAGSALPADCILFTEGGPDAPINADTRAEIARAFGPAGGNVFVLGGENAVSAAAAQALTDDGHTIGRLAGPTRFETAEEVANAAMAEVALARDRVIVAFGGDWADAVTAGAYARATITPVVLTGTDSLHPAAERVIDTVQAANPAAEVVLVGGESVVGPAVEAAVTNPLRIAGDNRMATAVAVAEDLWPAVPSTGEDFVFANLERPDAWTLALAAAPLAARIGGPELGLRADSYPTETEDYLEGLGLSSLPSVVLLGDLGFISEDVATQVEGSVGG